MKELNERLESNTNLAIIGEAGSGKSFMLKQILPKVLGKKVMVLSFDKNEYKNITNYLNGSYFNITESINFTNQLTTIFIDRMLAHTNVEAIFDIIKVAGKDGVEVVLIDEAYYCLEKCEDLLECINQLDIKLIVCSQFSNDLLYKRVNGEAFKKLFERVIIFYRIKLYSKLFELYKIKDSGAIIDLMKDMDQSQYIVIEDQKIEF